MYIGSSLFQRYKKSFGFFRGVGTPRLLRQRAYPRQANDTEGNLVIKPDSVIEGLATRMGAAKVEPVGKRRRCRAARRSTRRKGSDHRRAGRAKASCSPTTGFDERQFPPRRACGWQGR